MKFEDINSYLELHTAAELAAASAVVTLYPCSSYDTIYYINIYILKVR